MLLNVKSKDATPDDPASKEFSADSPFWKKNRRKGPPNPGRLTLTLTQLIVNPLKLFYYPT